MGVLSTLEYISEVISSGHKHMKMKKKLKQFQTINLKIRMDCDGCELKVKKALSSLTEPPNSEGVRYVEINRKQQKVTVSGYVEPNKVLKKAKSTGKKAEIWPYVPYNLVAQPYAPAAYDKKAPPGFVRKVDVQETSTSKGGSVTRFEDSYVISMFSDENPNACSIM
ncbi:Heavy metal-associated isoprenylated plant protein 23 [Orobanche gracilis]